MNMHIQSKSQLKCEGLGAKQLIENHPKYQGFQKKLNVKISEEMVFNQDFQAFIDLESLDDIVENYKSPLIDNILKKDSSATAKRSVLSYKHSATSNHSSIMQLQNENTFKKS